MDLQGKPMDYALNGKVMLCTGVVLFIVVIAVLCFHSYVRILFRDTRRRYMRHRARHLLSISTAGGAVPTAIAAPKGLDSSILKSIPTIVYAAAAKASCLPPLECAVCLSEFENDERARVLPKCSHTFHVDCIDMWFISHSNCPLCRAPVQAFIPIIPAKLQTAVPVAETANSGTVENIDTNSSSSSSSSSSHSSLELESCSMKKVELLGILVQVPIGAPCAIGLR